MSDETELKALRAEIEKVLAKMSEDADPSKEEELRTLRAEFDRLRAGEDRLTADRDRLRDAQAAQNLEMDRVRSELNELDHAAAFAAHYGDAFVAHYYDCIRQACEEADTDAPALIRKLPPFILDYLTPTGARRYAEKLSGILTDEEFQVVALAHKIAFEEGWQELKKRSSHA